jgi:hypothetical protein
MKGKKQVKISSPSSSIKEEYKKDDGEPPPHHLKRWRYNPKRQKSDGMIHKINLMSVSIKLNKSHSTTIKRIKKEMMFWM